MNLLALWRRIEARLYDHDLAWRLEIEEMGQVQAVRDRTMGESWSDDAVFEALLLAVLSAHTQWSSVENVLRIRKLRFPGYGLDAYARLSPSNVRDKLVPWFEAREVGSNSLPRNLTQLIETTRILAAHARKHGSADSYFTALMRQNGKDPKQVALLLGNARSKFKLPGFGIALAAEALKNLGYDVSKPDRHVQRAVAAFGLADNGPGGDRYQSPSKTIRGQLSAMRAVEEIAGAAGEYIVFVDNAIWLLGSTSGLHMTNAKLATLAAG